MQLLVCFFAVVHATKIIYVNCAAGAGGDGTTWGKAFPSLQSGLTVATVPSQVWVARCVYKPSVPYGGGYNGTEPNLVTFLLPNNTALYGGFYGNETSLAQRKPSVYITTLSGDINGDDNTGNLTDNAWHVVTADYLINSIVDGFTISGGYASGPDSGLVTIVARASTIAAVNYAHNLGAGVQARHGSQLSLVNIYFVNNSVNSSRTTMLTINPPIESIISGGAGVGVSDGGTLVTATSCTFFNGTCATQGSNGGAANVVANGSLTLISSTMTNNHGNRNGAAIHARDAGNIIITSCTCTANSVVGFQAGDESGGCIGVFFANLSITSSTFTSNVVGSVFGGGGSVFWHLPFDNGQPYQLAVTSSTFTGNSASTSGGGAISAFIAVPNAGTSVNIVSCLFSGNSAGTGGALYVDSVNTNIVSSSFTGNDGWTNGGAIMGIGFGGEIFQNNQFFTRSSLNVTSSNFYNNNIVGLPSLSAIPPVFIFNTFAGIFSADFGQPPANLTSLAVGGGAVSSLMGGRVYVSSSSFNNNNASVLAGRGGALQVGGSVGTAGGVPVGMNQAYSNIVTSTAATNGDSTGANNAARLDPAGIGNGQNAVDFVTDGSITSSKKRSIIMDSYSQAMFERVVYGRLTAAEKKAFRCPHAQGRFHVEP